MDVKMNLDLIIKAGIVATASDSIRADVGIRDGKIVVLAEHLEDDGAEIIDAT